MVCFEAKVEIVPHYRLKKAKAVPLHAMKALGWRGV
jgi:hypothetical protein